MKCVVKMEEVKNPYYRCVVSYVKSIVFYILSKNSYKNKDIISSTIDAYYSIFHLCNALYEIKPLVSIGEKKLHKDIIINTTRLRREGYISPVFEKVLKSLYKRRENVNYEPGLYSEGKNKPLLFYTCRFKNITDEIKEFQEKILRCYVEFGKFATNHKPANILLQTYSEQFFEFYLEWGVVSKEITNDCKSLLKSNSNKWLEKD